MLHYTSARHERLLLTGLASDQLHPSPRDEQRGIVASCPGNASSLNIAIDFYAPEACYAITFTAASFQHEAGVLP